MYYIIRLIRIYEVDIDMKVTTFLIIIMLIMYCFTKINRASIEAVDENGWTPLHYAAYSGVRPCCKALLLEGADRHLKDNKKRYVKTK